MWPGVDVELLQTKFSSGSEEQQKSWLDHSTIPTSWLVAFLVYKVNFKFGNRSDRTVAWKAMSAILAALLTGIGQFSIPHARFGDGANVDLVVDTQGHVQFSDIWTTQFYTSQARRWWTKDRGDSGKPWVSVEFAAGHTVPLLDIIVFLLDPQHSRQFQDRVRGVVLPLLTHVVGVLDDNVKSLSSQSNARGPWSGPMLNKLPPEYGTEQTFGNNFKALKRVCFLPTHFFPKHQGNDYSVCSLFEH